MNEHAQFSEKQFLSSKEILARASKLLTDSAQKASNVRQFEPNTIKDLNLRRDYMSSDGKQKLQKPDLVSASDNYGLYTTDLYKGFYQKPQLQEDSFAKQAVSAVDHGRTSEGRVLVGDDSVLSLPSMRAGRPNAFHYEKTLDSVDCLDLDITGKVFMSYFLHALEIERLVFVNKELVSEAQTIDKELENAEAVITQLNNEKRKAEAERDEYKFRWMEASKIIREDGGGLLLRSPGYSALKKDKSTVPRGTSGSIYESSTGNQEVSVTSGLQKPFEFIRRTIRGKSENELPNGSMKTEEKGMCRSKKAETSKPDQPLPRCGSPKNIKVLKQKAFDKSQVDQGQKKAEVESSQNGANLKGHQAGEVQIYSSSTSPLHYYRFKNLGQDDLAKREIAAEDSKSKLRDGGLCSREISEALKETRVNFQIENSSKESLAKPTANRSTTSCYKPLTNSRKSRANSVISQDEQSSTKDAGGKGVYETGNILDLIQHELGRSPNGPQSPEDLPQQESMSEVKQPENILNIFSKKIRHTERTGKPTSTQEYSLKSSLKLGGTSSNFNLGILQRSLKNSVKQYKPMMRTGRTVARNMTETPANLAMIDRILLKYSSKFKAA